MNNEQIIDELDKQAGPLFIMMIGPPGCGKSTLSSNLHGVTISMETEVETRYNTSKEKYLKYKLACAALKGENIIIDRICTTRKARRQQLKSLPVGYKAIAINLHNVEVQTLIKRMSIRPEAHRRIPEVALNKIFKEFEPPSKEEGFVLILTRTEI